MEVVEVESRIYYKSSIYALLFGRRLCGDLCRNVLHIRREEVQLFRRASALKGRLVVVHACVLVRPLHGKVKRTNKASTV